MALLHTAQGGSGSQEKVRDSSEHASSAKRDLWFHRVFEITYIVIFAFIIFVIIIVKPKE